MRADLRTVPGAPVLAAGRPGTRPPRLGEQALDDPQGPRARWQAVQQDEPAQAADATSHTSASSPTRTRSTMASTRPSSATTSGNACRPCCSGTAAQAGLRPEQIRRIAERASAVLSPAAAPCRQHTPRNKNTNAIATTSAPTPRKRGWHNCPSKSIPAPEIERFVVDQIKRIGRDPALLNETVAQAKSQGQSRVAELEAERRGLERELGRWNGEVRQLLDQIAPERRQHAGHGPVGGSSRANSGGTPCDRGSRAGRSP